MLDDFTSWFSDVNQKDDLRLSVKSDVSVSHKLPYFPDYKSRGYFFWWGATDTKTVKRGRDASSTSGAGRAFQSDTEDEEFIVDLIDLI